MNRSVASSSHRGTSLIMVLALLATFAYASVRAPQVAVAAPSAPTTPAASAAKLIRISGVADKAVIVKAHRKQARAVQMPVRVQVSGWATSLVVRLNGHPLTARGGRYVLDRSAHLQLGENQLWVEATIHGRARPAVASRTFYVGYRSDGIVAGSVLRGRGDAPAAVARLRLPAKGIHRIAAEVNNKTIDVPKRDGTTRIVRWNLAQLGRLHAGRNHLRVRVLTDSGRVGVVDRTVTVSRTRQLVAARVQDGPAHVDATLTLDTSRSRLTGRQAADANVRWTLLRRPLFSKARLGAAHGAGRQAEVALRPDVPGHYLVGVRIGSGSTAGYDVLEVVATYPNPLVPFQTITYPGGSGTAPALQLGTQTVLSDGQGFAVYVLDRRSLEVTAVKGYPTSSSGISAMSSYFDTLTDSSMVILTLPGSKAPAGGASLEGVVDKIGGNVAHAYGFVDGYCWTATPNKCSTEGSHWVSSNIDTGSFSYIGVPGLAPGQAWRAIATRSGTTDGFLQGWLTLGVASQSSTADEYTVIPGTDVYKGVDTCTSDGCAVKVGDQTYAPTAGVANGMHVVVLDRTTLKPLANTTVTNLTDFVNVLSAGWGPKAGTLFYTSPMLFDDQRLVILQSIGTGQLTGTVNFVNLSLIDLLGGTTETFVKSIDGAHRYALVGAPTNIPFHGSAGLESSTVMTTTGAIAKTATGQISGIITPNRQMMYTPQSGDPVGPTNNELYSILYQPAQAWPYADDTDVLAYIADNLGLTKYPDVRSAYTDSNYKYSWGGFLAELTAMTCTGQSFCGTEFTQVQSELKVEFGWVPQIQAFIDNMQSPYIQSGSDPYFNVMNVTNQVSAAVPPPPSASSSMGFLSIFVDSLFVGDAIAGAAGAEAEPFIGLLASSLSMASDLIQTPDGGSASTVNATAAQLASEMADQQTASVEGLDRMQDILLTDYGRLHDVGTALDTDPDWTWDTGDTPDAVDTLNASARSSAFTALVPLTWTAFTLKPGSTEKTTNDVTAYVCDQGGDEAPYPGKPFAKATALSQLQMASAPTTTSNPDAATTLYEVWVLAQLGTWDYQSIPATMIPDSLTTDIYGPASTGPTGAFQYQPTWWHDTYPVPHYVICNTSGSFDTTWSQHYAPPKLSPPLN